MIGDAGAAALALRAYLRGIGWDVRGCELSRLAGGAGPETWHVRLVRGDGGATRLVLRTDAATRLLGSLSRGEEYAALRLAWTAGVPVAEPVVVEPSARPLGAPFILVAEVDGTARPAVLLGGSPHDRMQLARQSATILGRIHAAASPRSARAYGSAVADALGWTADQITKLDHARPALDYAQAWCVSHHPPESKSVFAHRDFRVGNLMVSNGRIVAVLDWEYARPSDPHEDLGWFCAPAWRHGRLALEAGGLVPREPFLAAYEAVSGWAIERARVTWWSVLGQLRWALIAIAQGRRALGGQPDLDLALTGHRLPQIERDLLYMIAPGGTRTEPTSATQPPFTRDGPVADDLETVAAQVEAGGVDDAVLRATLHRIAARLRAAPPCDTARAVALSERIRRCGPRALEDRALWRVLSDEAVARCAISDRDAP